MKGEGGMPPGSGDGDGRLGARKNPRRFEERWMEAMRDGLPSQVLRPLRVAISLSRSRQSRLRALDEAVRALAAIKAQATIYSGSVERRFDGLGIEYVDPSNPEQAAAFLDRIGTSGLRALDKRQRVAAAIAYAEMTIEWLDWELSNG